MSSHAPSEPSPIPSPVEPGSTIHDGHGNAYAVLEAGQSDPNAWAILDQPPGRMEERLFGVFLSAETDADRALADLKTYYPDATRVAPLRRVQA